MPNVGLIFCPSILLLPIHSTVIPSHASKSPRHLQSSLDTWVYFPGKTNTHRTPSSNRSLCKLVITHSFPHTPVQTQPHKQSVCNGASVWVAKQKAPCPPPRHLLCSDVPTVSAFPPLSPPFFFCCRYPTWDLICSLNSYANWFS